MLDDILDYIEGIEERPVWQPIPEEARARFREPLPRAGSSLPEAHGQFMADVLPFSTGNTHPGFMGWVHGGGTPVGMLAEMLAAGLNANLGGRDHMPIEVERQILIWMRELFGFPETASGLFVTGTSMANLMAVLIARTTVLGFEVRRQGLAAGGKRLQRLYLRRRPWLRAPSRRSRGAGQRGAAPDRDRRTPAHGSRGAGGGHRGRPGAGLHALPYRRHCRHGGCRRGRRSRRNRRSGPARGASGSTSMRPMARSL